MDLRLILTVVFSLAVVISAQRSPYAGSRPLGYKDRFTPTPAAQLNEIGNRFGNANAASGNLIAGGSTQRVPIDALQDREVFNILNRYPVDKQPFWFASRYHQDCFLV